MKFKNRIVLSIILLLVIFSSCSQSKKSTDMKSNNYEEPAQLGNETKWVPYNFKGPGMVPYEINYFYKDEIVYMISMVDEPPILTKQARPDYPDIARIKQIQGTVVITVIIDENGNVIKTKIHKSVPGLNKPARAAAMRCKFNPARVKGKAVKVCLNIPFNFRLR